MAVHPVLVAGEWRAAAGGGTFRAEEPGAPVAGAAEEYPVSQWTDLDAALSAAVTAAGELQAASSNGDLEPEK